MSSARVQEAIKRTGHVCNDRCVVGPTKERHYGQFGELVAASMSRGDHAVLVGWTILVTLMVAVEGWTLFR